MRPFKANHAGQPPTQRKPAASGRKGQPAPRRGEVLAIALLAVLMAGGWMLALHG